MASSAKYKAFLPEFPLLHLRKSKLTILFSGYKDAGLIQLVRIMRDDEKSDWSKLASVTHIDVATRHVKRLALSFQLAFLIAFSQTLGHEDLQSFLGDMESLTPVQIAENWNAQFEKFIEEGRQKMPHLPFTMTCLFIAIMLLQYHLLRDWVVLMDILYYYMQ